MLLTKSNYEELALENEESSSKGNLIYYLLDKSEEKKRIVDKIAKERQLIPFEIGKVATLDRKSKRNLTECTYPSVSSWIRGFMNAEFIFTDSFHGTVFSILFNKPFLVIMNKRRGSDRFNSLLNCFGLNGRLIYSCEDITKEHLQFDIDWTRVNSILEEKRNESMRFLKKAFEE